MKNRRLGGALGVRVIAVECLEQAWAIVVETAEIQIAQLFANFVCHHKTRIDHLARFAIAKFASVFCASHRIFDRAKEPHKRLQLLVFERTSEMQADHSPLCESVLQCRRMLGPRANFDARNVGGCKFGFGNCDLKHRKTADPSIYFAE